jgi:hypothetical protein
MEHSSVELAAAVAALLLAGTGIAVAKAVATVADIPVPCTAFARDDDGGWRVLEPVMLSISGRPVSFVVGTEFAPRTTQLHGIKMPVLLDRECGTHVGSRAEALPRR